jgi:hypothetical protein
MTHPSEISHSRVRAFAIAIGFTLVVLVPMAVITYPRSEKDILREVVTGAIVTHVIMGVTLGLLGVVVGLIGAVSRSWRPFALNIVWYGVGLIGIELLLFVVLRPIL